MCRREFCDKWGCIILVWEITLTRDENCKRWRDYIKEPLSSQTGKRFTTVRKRNARNSFILSLISSQIIISLWMLPVFKYRLNLSICLVYICAVLTAPNSEFLLGILIFFLWGYHIIVGCSLHTGAPEEWKDVF